MPVDALLPPLDVKTENGTVFSHAEGADVLEEAAVFCGGFDDAYLDCAADVVALARREAAERTVEAEAYVRRAAIEEAIEASLSRAPGLWDKVRQKRSRPGDAAEDLAEGIEVII